MDHRDSDFPTQNFQLAGEDNHKFPQGLGSLTLPKFDIGEHLADHLRFDSLVETEGLLDIQGQGNDWIEDFTAVGNEIEFSSTAAERCLISRPKNVWSEATSSESVEMLLKSVVEDEMIEHNATIKEADAIDVSTEIYDQANLCSSQNDSKVKTVNSIDSSKDVNSDQFPVPDCSEHSRNEKHERFRDGSDKFGYETCSIPEVAKVSTLSPDCTMETSSAIKQDTCEVVQSSNLSHNEYMKSAAVNPIACTETGDKTDKPTLWTTEDGLSSSSTDNLILMSGKMESDVLSEQMLPIKGCNISGYDKPLYLSKDDVTSVDSTLSIEKVKMDDNCEATKRNCSEEVIEEKENPKFELSGNVDSHEKDISTIKIAVSAKDCSLVTEGNENVEMISVGIVSKDVTILSSLKEACKSSRSTEALQLLKDETNCIGGALSVKNIKAVDICEGTQLTFSEEVTIEKQNPNLELTGGNDRNDQDTSIAEIAVSSKETYSLVMNGEDDIEKTSALAINSNMVGNYERTELGISDRVIEEIPDPVCVLTDANTSNFTAEVHSSNDTGHEMIGKTKLDALQFDPLAPQNIAAKDCDDEVNDNVTKESRFSRRAAVNECSKELSSTSLNNKLFDKCDKNEFTGEAYQVSTPPELMSSLKDNPSANVDPASLNSQCGSYLLAEKDNASCMGQKASLQIARECSSDLNHCTNSSSTSEILTSRNTESHLSNSEIANASTSEQHCGSPTILTGSDFSSEHSQEVGDRVGNGDRMDPADSDPSFTFKVELPADMSVKKTANNWKPFPTLQDHEPQLSKEDSMESHIKVEKKPQEMITRTPDNSYEQVFGGSSLEGMAIPPVEAPKLTTRKQFNEEDINPYSTPKSLRVADGNLASQEIEQYPSTESKLRESYHAMPDLSTSTTSTYHAMPDLSTSTTSTSLAALSRQPFTYLQQVQLRAQIFVYGSIMQATPPDEACMISAFGETDGGRSLWEKVWRASVERCQIQKSSFCGYETPSPSNSGVRVSLQVRRSSSLQSKAPGHTEKSVRKAVSTAMVNSTLPLSSPLWSDSCHDGLRSHLPKITNLDFSQAKSPVNSHRSSQLKQHTSISEPWVSQFPRPGSSVRVSQNSALDVSSQLSTVSTAETVQLTSVRDSFIPHSHNMDVVPPTVLPSAPNLTGVCEASVVQMDSGRKRTHVNDKSFSTVPKSRKKKKDSLEDQEFHPNMLVSQLQSVPASATVVMGNTLAASGLPIPAVSPPKLSSGAPVSASTSIISPTNCHIDGTADSGQRVIFSEETCSNIQQARLQAEDASALAASAVRHSQDLWGQLTTQKNSGVISEVDEKLAFAAIAAAAAASVAKAAAAAAKVASDASLQAKLMFDEALNSVRTRSPSDISEPRPLGMGKSSAELTPNLILTGKDKTHGSSSIISVAREAARKRVKAASAATKRAENMDAIVRAAELAAEAVSQAGSIIGLGEPLPFTLGKLVDAGQLASHQFVTDKSAKADTLHQVKVVVSEDDNICCESVKHLNECAPNIEGKQKTIDEDGTVSSSEVPVQSKEHIEENDSCKMFPTDGADLDDLASKSEETTIQKGCLAEVIVHKDGLGGAWFSAQVLEVKDGEAYISYDKRVSDEGTCLLKEWVSLVGEGNQAPRIRLPHPTTVAKCANKRKRSREAMENYVYAVGDRVDAWVHDGWREGIVTKKSQGSDCEITVHFPGGGDSLTFREWNLRPSLVWKDGHWIESSHARGDALQPCERDDPEEKRQKLCRPESSITSGVNGKGISKTSNSFPADDSKIYEESRQAILSAKDRTCSVRKNTRVNNNSDALKVRRTGRQKERPGVVFGVPKPGKNCKYMEVSKHYINGKTEKARDGNDSNRYANFVMSQTPRIPRSTSKVDSKGRDASASNQLVVKSMKPRSIRTRRTLKKENPSITRSSNGAESKSGSLPNARNALSNALNDPEKSQLQDGSCASLGAMNDPDMGPSENSSPAVEMDLTLKGNRTPSVVDKSTRSRDFYKDIVMSTSNIPEPRRSVRRIQPTSRLLEGLQSSLTVSRIPSFSHDKGAKAQPKGSSSRGNARP